jgi:hypothetical protein
VIAVTDPSDSHFRFWLLAEPLTEGTIKVGNLEYGPGAGYFLPAGTVLEFETVRRGSASSNFDWVQPRM